LPQHANESVDDDLLLTFLSEPGGKPPESTVSLAARVDSLERALHRSTSQIAALKSEVTTLVGTIDEIGKRVRRPVQSPITPAPTRRTPYLTAIGGIVFGLALGVFGWTLLSGDLVSTIAMLEMVGTSPQALAGEPVVGSTPASQPVPLLAVAVTEPEAPNAEAEPVPSPVDFVGTLSIDAAPGGQVFIDREAAGETPLRVQNLKSGSHLVWIEREGYRRFTRVVEVPADRVSQVWTELQPLPVR
jgi:PEGA domain